jgi:hypothetical protein
VPPALRDSEKTDPQNPLTRGREVPVTETGGMKVRDDPGPVADAQTGFQESINRHAAVINFYI